MCRLRWRGHDRGQCLRVCSVLIQRVVAVQLIVLRLVPWVVRGEGVS